MSSFEIANYLDLDALPRFHAEEAGADPRALNINSVEDKDLMKHAASPALRVGILSLQQNEKSNSILSSALPIADAISTAIAEINEAEGVLGQRLEPITITEINNSEALERQTRSLLEDPRVKAIFSWGTSPTLCQKIFPLVETANTLLWHCDRTPGGETFSRIFYTGTCPNQRVEAAIAWLQKTERKKCYMIDSPVPLSQRTGKIFREQWQARGELKHVAVGENPDWEALLAAIATENPDIIIDTRSDDATALYEAYQNTDLAPECCPILALNFSLNDIENLGNRGEGHYFLSPYFPAKGSPLPAFLPANEIAAAAYTQVYLWKQAVETAGSFQIDRVRAAAIGQTFSETSGIVCLTPNQHLARPLFVGSYRQGNFSLAYSSNRAINPIPWLGLQSPFTRDAPRPKSHPSPISPSVPLLQREVKENENSQPTTHKNLIAELEGERERRKEIEAAVQEYGTALRALFAATSDAILITDANGCYLRVAPTQPLPPFSHDSIGRTLHDIFPPERADRFLDCIRTAIEEQRPVQLEYHWENTWFSATISPINDNEVLWIVRDISQQKQIEWKREQTLLEFKQQFQERTTALRDVSDRLVGEVVERQHAEDALNAAKDQLQAILDAVPGNVSWISSDLRYLGVNHHLAGKFNLKPDAFIGQDIGFLNASEEFINFIRDFFASEAMDDFREITSYVQGSSRTYLIVVQKYNRGKAAFTVGIDVTKRQEALNALARSKAQLQAVLEAVPGIVSWISSDLRYLGVNRHLAKTFNLTPEDFVGKNIGFLQASDDFNQFVQEFFAAPEQDNFREVEALVDGETRNFLIAAQKYDNGEAAFTVGIDITDRQQAIEDLHFTKDQLQAVLEAVPGIVSWIGSDLRYLGVNRHLAKTFDLPVEAFTGQSLGFLQASEDFNEFVSNFFASSEQDNFREVETIVEGEPRNFLIAAQKYDEGRAAFTVGIDVTERQQALEALQKAEEKYRTIFENAVEGIFQTTPDGRYLSANPALARIYGYDSPEDLIANLDNLEERLYVDPQRRRIFTHTIETEGGVVGFEAHVRRRDGQLRWISENARAVRDKKGKILYYEGTVEDITDRKLAEEKLRKLNEELETRVQQRTNELQQLNLQLLLEIGERERIESALRTSEAELKALFAAMTDIITVFDANGNYAKIVTTNSETIYSPKSELLGKNVREVFSSEQAQIFRDNIRDALETGETVYIEYSLDAAQPGDVIGDRSGTVWFSASVSPLPNNCVIWVARNITKRKQMQLKVEKAEEKYRSIFENAAEGIFQSTRDGRYISANPALVAMYGYDSFAEMAALVSQIDRCYVEPELRNTFREQLERKGSVNGFKAQVKRKDGSSIWTSENARVVRDNDGNILFYEGTVADITKQKEAEDALRLEREKSDRLLLNILPKAIAERLKQNEKSIAERFDSVSILFADIVEFTSLSAKISPTALVDLLNEMFSSFDKLTQWYNLEKIKTIGDSYMVAGGLPDTTVNHAEAMADLALDMQLAISKFEREEGQPFQVRIGINTGPVVAGVIGINKFIYDLWGDTVNVASRMESQGKSNEIQITEDTYELIKDRFFFEEQGEIPIKGKGKMKTYFLKGRL
ncbi:MAG: PAS domain S-box protein [Cyanobacteria bacterium SBLK]|nr:PAS domain S-box protein [Cyanobacteria bacterium SBLK]